MNAARPPLSIRTAAVVRVLTLDRPAAANAIDTTLATALAAALDDAARDESIGAVVITGAGRRVFCAGADLKNSDQLTPEAIGAERRRNFLCCIDALLSFDKPVVVALNGVASGAGAMLALLADEIVAANESCLVMPEIDLGVPSFIGHALLAMQVGEPVATGLILSGRRLPADEAARRGSIAAVVPFDELAAAAEARASLLATKPQGAVSAMKHWLNRRRRSVVEAAMAAQERHGVGMPGQDR